MGRRKKEPQNVHRERIGAVASELFLEKGIGATSMDDIARAAGYSKATLYVYFENKEEIVSLLALDSMKKLCACISRALRQEKSTKAKYDLICQELVRYQEEFPFYFQMTLEKLNFTFENEKYFPEEKETFQVGEEINQMMEEFLVSGMEKGDLRGDMEVQPAFFSCWGMLSGLIQFAASKKEYMESAMGLSKEQFLQYGFQMIYHAVSGGEGEP